MVLNNKQQLFIEKYLECWNATKAATEAGYSHPRQQGSRLLSHVDISAAIKERLQEATMSADEVLMRLTDQARASFDDFLDESGEIDLIKARNAGKLHLLNSVTEPTKFKGREISLHSQQKALELLGRAHGLFTDRLIQENRGKIEIEYTNDWREAGNAED